MSGIKTFNFSVSNHFAVGTVAKMEVAFSDPLCIADSSPCQSFNFSVIIDNNKTNQSIPMSADQAKQLALKKAIKMLEDFAASQQIPLETNQHSTQADQ